MSKTLCEARLSVRKAGGFAVLGAGGARLAPLALASAVLGGGGWSIGDVPTAQVEIFDEKESLHYNISAGFS